MRTVDSYKFKDFFKLENSKISFEVEGKRYKRTYRNEKDNYLSFLFQGERYKTKKFFR
jgi:hypothetical protein